MTNPYLRTFSVGALWFGAVAAKLVSRHSGHWSTYPIQNLLSLFFAWIITALLLGLLASRIDRVRSWWAVGVLTMVGSIGVLGLMLFAAERANPVSSGQQFESTDAMMAHFANEAARWVREDGGGELDFSLESVKTIEKALGGIAKEIDPSNLRPGTAGVVVGYGAYIGEVFRRRDGGSWAVDHPAGGPQSYPLTTKSNVTIFPVRWCWKRLINGEEDNVYQKAVLFWGTNAMNSAELRDGGGALTAYRTNREPSGSTSRP